jgi:hypothetical protein
MRVFKAWVKQQFSIHYMPIMPTYASGNIDVHTPRPRAQNGNSNGISFRRSE